MKKVTLIFFLFFPFSIFSLTKEFAQQKCLAGINSVSIPKDHKHYNTLNEGRKYLVSYLDLMEGSKIDEVPEILYKCMAGVDALRWFLNEFDEVPAKEENFDDATTKVEKDQDVEKAGS